MAERTSQRQLIEAMVSLEGNPDYEMLMQYVADELSRMKDSLVLCGNDQQLKMLQGQAQAYQGLVNQGVTARDDLARLREVDKKRRNKAANNNQGIAPVMSH